MLTIHNLSKTINQKRILAAVSLTVTKGEIAILLGPSGVGKSTLLRILNNLESYDSGTVTVDGKPLDLMTVTKTHTIGMVFQQFHLFDHLNALENITLALVKVHHVPTEQAPKQAHVLLHQFHLADKATAYPRDLSGGQKQRLALARMLALKPQILCLDEPTSALDPILTSSIAHILNELAQQGSTILVTTHDMSLVKQLPLASLHLMNQGTIIESSPPKGFAQQPHEHPNISQFIQGVSSPHNNYV